MSHRPTGAASSRLVAVLGPTNTGKTHLAVERMLGHASGMIGLPLRLLAREIYDRIVRVRGARSVALITGEEKIVPPRAVYFVCTVEAMPLSREVEFLAVDEIQLCADPERGHVFTQRLLHARGTAETMLLGAGTMAPLLTSFSPDALEAAQSAQPQLPRGLLLEHLWTGWLETALRLGCVAVVCNQALWDESSVRQARSAGLRMSSYTVNDEWAAERLLALGTDAIITDRVDLFSASR